MTTPAGMAAAMRTRPLEVDLERDEVALVHADERGADGERPLELGLVVHLDEHVEPELDGQRRGSRRSSAAGSAATISSTASAPISRAS